MLTVPNCDLAHHLESRVRAGCRVVASSGLAIADLIVIMRGGLVYSLHCDAQLTGLTVSHIFTLIKLERCQRAWNNV